MSFTSIRKVVKVDQVRSITSLSRTTIWRLERDGKFPARVRLCSTSVGWYEDEILAWLNTLPRGGKR